MREAAFINKNKERWLTLEEMLKGERNLPSDELSGLFIQLTDDLSYARTFYPQSNVAVYLNGLSQLLHQRIYKNKKTDGKVIGKFWRIDVPLLAWRRRKELLFSFIVFCTAALIGALSAAHDDTFARLILGDYYVEMTLENIEKGKPMDVYANDNSSDMFFRISFNNIRVSFFAFMLGLFFSIGTMMLLIYNGIMLGTFQYFFFQKGVLLTSILSIWIHGTLEITAIIIAGGAGIVLGNGFMFPGTYSRVHSFRTGAVDGVKLIAGLVPIFLIAAFFEGFVTRLAPEMPAAASATIILLSLAFVIYYFVILPIRLKNRIEDL